MMETALVRVQGGRRTEGRDAVALEEPLEIRLARAPFAVLMRTPGADRELVAGFLFSEQVISSAGELEAVEPCTDPDHPQAQNIVTVTLGGRAAAALEQVLAARRHVASNSACGLCGRVSLDSIQVAARRVDAPLAMAAATMLGLPEVLRGRQSMFSRTGGLHAAALFRRDGSCDRGRRQRSPGR